MRWRVPVLLLLSGCSVAPSPQLNPYARSGEVMRWCWDYEGHPADGMQGSLGKPAKTAELPDGQRVLYFYRTGWKDYLAVTVDTSANVRECDRASFVEAARGPDPQKPKRLRLR